jgi:hypothetical protein
MLAMIRALVFGPRSPAPSPDQDVRALPSAPGSVLPTRGLDADASADALRAAFDYRGDVTLTLDDGTRVEGFVSDPGPEAIQLWPVGESVPVAIEARRVRRVALNGRDPAARGRAEHAAPAPA